MSPLKISCLLIALLLASVAVAQQTPLQQALKNKQYAEFLQQCQPIFAPVAKSPGSAFDQVTACAIALEKTAGWKGTMGNAVREGIKASPDALRYLDAMRALLGNRMQEIASLLIKPAPDTLALLRASQLLREHGFTVAADALGAFAPDLPGKRLLYMVSIPKELRSPVEEAFLTQVSDPPNRMMLARAGIEMFLRPPAGVTVDLHDIYMFALKLGKGTSVVSFETAEQLSQGGKPKEAVEMVTQLTTEQPADVLLQLRAARFLRTLGNHDAATMLYRQALTTVPEPQRREVRLDYLEYLQWQKKVDEIAKLQTGKDVLLAADAALVSAQYDDAAKRYATVMTDAAMPAEKRLAAWEGLLDADPGQALAKGKDVLQGLSKLDARNRSELVTWSGRQLWAVLGREVPAKRGAFVMGWRQHFRPVHDVEGWETQAAALASQLLDLDAEACLRPDARFTPDSFRYPAAMLYAFAGKPKEAMEILTRSMTFQIPPPPGGWRIFDGTPTPDTDKPRTRTSPTLAEAKKLTMQLLEDLARCPNANERVPALSALIADDLVAQLAKDTKEADIRTHMQTLATVIKSTVVALDPLPRTLRTDLPPPPVREVDMAAFAPLATTVSLALANDTVAKSGLYLVREEGLLGALLTASNPKLLNALLDLAVLAIDRSAAVRQQPLDATREGNMLADYLANRPVFDMKTYVKRLHEHYPKK